MNRRSFLGLFGKTVALADVPTALLRSAPVAAEGPEFLVSHYAAPGDFPLRTQLTDQMHDAGGALLLVDGKRA